MSVYLLELVIKVKKRSNTILGILYIWLWNHRESIYMMVCQRAVFLIKLWARTHSKAFVHVGIYFDEQIFIKQCHKASSNFSALLSKSIEFTISWVTILHPAQMVFCFAPIMQNKDATCLINFWRTSISQIMLKSFFFFFFPFQLT